MSLQTHLSFVKSHGRQGSVYFLINKTNNDNRKHSTGDLSSASPFVAGEVVFSLEKVFLSRQRSAWHCGGLSR